MEVGTSITLRLSSNLKTDGQDIYRCKIIDRDDRYLYIDYPINVNTKKVVFVPVNEYVVVNYVVNGVANEFISTIAKRVELTVPALAINLPEEEEIKRIQRREFVRVETAVDVAMHFPKSSYTPIISVTYDISGGGAAVIMPPNIKMAQEQDVKLYLVLHSLSLGYEYIKIDAEIVRFHTIEKVNIVSLKFNFVSNQEQQKIIHYCFDKQREDRQQQLL